jgi:hypothetical protein
MYVRVSHLLWRYSPGWALASIAIRLQVSRSLALRVSLHSFIPIFLGRTGKYKSNNEARSCNNSCRTKAISITYSECESVALVIRYAMRMRHIILLSVACVDPLYFATSHKRHNFRGKKLIEPKMPVLIFCTNFVRNVSNCKNNSGRYHYKFA